jgi:acyl carrier protein
MNELLAILTELHEDVDFANCQADLFDDKIIDSFDIVTIIGEIYERFDVTISAEYIIPANFNSVAALWALIEKLQDEE